MSSLGWSWFSHSSEDGGSLHLECSISGLRSLLQSTDRWWRSQPWELAGPWELRSRPGKHSTLASRRPWWHHTDHPPTREAGKWSVACLQDEMVMDFGRYTANSAQKIKPPAPPYVLEECLSIMWGCIPPYLETISPEGQTQTNSHPHSLSHRTELPEDNQICGKGSS